MSAVTVALLDRSDLPDLGVYRLDGDAAEQHIFQLGAGKHPALRGQHHRPGNIPLRLGRLIGRDQDLEVIARALAQSPVVTLVGPGGIGKTRLALAAAQLSDLGRSGGPGSSTSPASPHRATCPGSWPTPWESRNARGAP